MHYLRPFLSTALGMAFTLQNTTALVVAGDDQPDDILPLIIFLDQASEKSALDPNYAAIDPVEDLQSYWEDFADREMAKFNALGENGPSVRFTDVQTKGDPKGGQPKLINYCVHKSKLREATTFLLQNPRIERVAVSEFATLSSNAAQDDRLWPRVVKLKVPEGESWLRDVLRTDGVNDLGWHPTERDSYFIACSSRRAFELLGAIDSVTPYDVTLSELKQYNLMSERLARYFRRPDSATGKWTIAIPRNQSPQKALRAVPKSIQVAEVSKNSLVLLGTEAEFTTVVDALKLKKD